MPVRTDPMAAGLAVLNRLAGSAMLDRLRLRSSAERAVYHGARGGFTVATKAGRAFARRGGGGSPSRPTTAPVRGVFDLTPTDDQDMIVGVVRELAAELLRPGAEAAEAANATSSDVLAQANELGLSQLGVPESLGGLAEERSAVTAALVAEALAQGDMGQAVACLSPAAVSTALALYGSDAQQQTYLPAFVGDDVPAASFAVTEPQPLFDPTRPATRAVRTPAGFRLDGVKSAVVRGADAELFVVAADLEGEGPRMFLVEAGTAGLGVAPDPAMGLRAAALTRLSLDGVEVGPDALLGDGDDYRDALRRARIAWAALAVGTGQAVLDYVKEYVLQREAFGEPIAHRQAVAFMVADVAIELEGMRLAVRRAASRADQGLDVAREAGIAKQLASEHGMRIGTDGVQLLGGHGFVKEHPVERWYRDLRAVGVMEGALLV
jgi:alkylation response protein AidB-like acyl-CoA dehydrogenase